MIKNFKHKGLEKFFQYGSKAGIQGEILRELCLEPLGISVTKAAESLGVTRKTLSAILNGRAGISTEMAIRLSLAFDTSPESWLNQQTQYDRILFIFQGKLGVAVLERLFASVKLNRTATPPMIFGEDTYDLWLARRKQQEFKVERLSVANPT